MTRQQAFEAIYAKQHDIPAESLVQYRHESKDGYNLPGIASHYRFYCLAIDSEEIQALRKNAERYHWIRQGEGEAVIIVDPDNASESGICPCHVIIGDEVDEYIDDILAREAEK